MKLFFSGLVLVLAAIFASDACSQESTTNNPVINEICVGSKVPNLEGCFKKLGIESAPLFHQKNSGVSSFKFSIPHDYFSFQVDYSRKTGIVETIWLRVGPDSRAVTAISKMFFYENSSYSLQMLPTSGRPFKVLTADSKKISNANSITPVFKKPVEQK